MTGKRAARRFSLLVTALIAAVTVAIPASADPTGGATYTGVAADGASITLTVSPDGTLVTSYRITNVKTTTGYQFTEEGDQGVWEGAPITDDAFAYRLGDAIVLHGSFAGAQMATGTFSF